MRHSTFHTKKILVVDDELRMLEMVKTILFNDGFNNIVTATSVSESVLTILSEKPDLAILDVMLPDGDGFTLLRRVRTSFPDLPVIFLTAKDNDADKSDGFALNADDYVVKPFSPKELLWRTYAVLRRCYKETARLVNLENCTIDLDRIEVNKDGQITHLTATEYKILEVLIRNKDTVVKSEGLCEAVWPNEDQFKRTETLPTYIHRIREKIEADPAKPVSLITKSGFGYQLNVRK